MKTHCGAPHSFLEHSIFTPSLHGAKERNPQRNPDPASSVSTQCGAADRYGAVSFARCFVLLVGRPVFDQSGGQDSLVPVPLLFLLHFRNLLSSTLYKDSLGHVTRYMLQGTETDLQKCRQCRSGGKGEAQLLPACPASLALQTQNHCELLLMLKSAACALASPCSHMLVLMLRSIQPATERSSSKPTAAQQ